MSTSLMDESKKPYYAARPTTNDDLKVGCLQRIAAATELMAQNNSKLVDERDRLKCRCERMEETISRLDRSNAALRGVITKLKKK